jgi:carnitine 3-dehydrogenase
MTSDRVRPEHVERVAVLGAGTIGASWAALFLARGLAVDVFDVAADSETLVKSYVDSAWPALERIGMADNADPSRLRFFSDPADAVANAQFVQESVPERLDLKRQLYRLIEPALLPGTLVASSASGLLVKEMQSAFDDPSRFLLAHPFNPPHLIPLVELLGNELTARDAVPWCREFFQRCGKVTVKLRREVPGHVANRLQAALWREAIHLVVEGVASVEDVDNAVVNGPGLRWAIMGPHMLFNLGSGGHGLEVFCDRFRDSFHRWWNDLGTPQLDPELARTLEKGVIAEARGRGFAELAKERDEKLISVLQALQDLPGRPAARGETD